MTRQASTVYAPRRENGLKTTLLYEDGYGNWGWWCPTRVCSPTADVCGKDGYKTRDGARRAAQVHEKGAH